jgi:hypothetical protein
MRAAAIGSVLGTVVTIAAAALVWHSLPVNTQIYAPFDVHAGIGVPAVGENLTGTVTAASVTPTLVSESSGKKAKATGVWVVVTTSLTTDDAPALPHADLMIGPDTYLTTDRVIAGGGGLLQPSITQERLWTFDVAPDVLDSVSSVVLRIWTGDSRLDSRLVIDIPLTAGGVDRPESVVLPKSNVMA